MFHKLLETQIKIKSGYNILNSGIQTEWILNFTGKHFKILTVFIPE